MSVMELAKLNPSQRVLFNQFADAVANYRPSEWIDDYLLKWLVARDFDVQKAEAMLLQSLEWRQIHQIDGILDNWTPPEVMKKYYAMGTVGSDKFGCPVWINAFGRIDMAGLLQSVSKRDYIRYLAYITEMSHRQMHQNSLVTGKPVSYQTLVIDMAELSINQLTKQFMDVGMELTHMFLANYPEGVRRVFVINVPQIFSTAFTFVKPFLSAATLAKLSMFSHDSKMWKNALLEEIDASQLPVHYGGTMTDPDGNPMCLTKISMGGQVPQTYYLERKQPVPGDQMISDLIPAGKRKLIEITVEEAKSFLRWEFVTEDGDINFQLVYVRDNGENLIILPRDRYECHQLMEKGEIVCIYSGRCKRQINKAYELKLN
ncbi:hypothetical protein GHT06_012232 [Daphnia sinensis]|uniref:CRAL-TRIO domain-containing protein n=1 Tax=Daphnia sinensis TaxID=1820382 RepID=A0AAD5KVC0_9CRUS|nr:hypothetical protein GHT06_012232 [Daphnia sinensis]